MAGFFTIVIHSNHLLIYIHFLLAHIFLLMLFFGEIMPILTIHLPNIYNTTVCCNSRRA